MTYGLSAAGFTVKTFPQIVGELQSAYQGIFGSNIPLTPAIAYANGLPTTTISVYDQLIGIHAEREADLWELGLAIYLASYPDTAQGAQLANAGQLTGQTPIAASYSTVTQTINGTPGTVIPLGSQVGISGTQTAFATNAAATIPGGGSVTAACTATVTGPLTAPIGTLTQILTPVAGWTSTTNGTAAIVGLAQETDAAFKARRASNLTVADGGPVPAMVNYIANNLIGTTFVGGTSNRTDATVGGLPPHSVQMTIISTATNTQIAQAIWNCLGGGINTSGSVSGTALDSFNNPQTVYWNTGVNVPMYLSVTITRDPLLYPATGDTQVQTALANYVNALGNGVTVQDWQLGAQLIGIPGINALTILLDRNPGPTGTASLVFAGNEKPTLSTTNIAML